MVDKTALFSHVAAMEQLAAVLLLLPVLFVTVSKCQCIDLRVGQHVVDGSDEASGQVTSDGTEVVGTNCSETSAVQGRFAEQGRFAVQGRFDRNESASSKDKTSAMNSTDMVTVTKLGHDGDLFEDAGTVQSVNNTLQEFEGRLYVSDNDSDSDTDTSHIGEGHVTAQQKTDYADDASVVTGNRQNDSSVNTEGDLEDDETDFNRFLSDMSTLYQNHITPVNDSRVKEGKDVILRDDYRSESHNEAMNESLTGPQLFNEQQSDSAVDEYIVNAFQSEETFEHVFSISEDDALDSEARHCFGCQSDSERHAEHGAESDIAVAVSNTERSSVDNEDNDTALNNVFEVHYYSRSSDTSDPLVAVTGQNMTLAERVEQLVLNRLPSLSNLTDDDDAVSGGAEGNDISLGVEISPDEIYENEDEETHSGASLAFVFDSTGSMFDDLVQVKIGAERIMATMLERPDKPIYNYVLVPFHDPKIGPVTVTTDHNEFRKSLHNITVHGGGDCPEMAIGAVKEALSISLPNSFIYVFTDARAKDFNLITEVLALIQRKHSQVVFVMTGDCGDNKHIGYQVYEEIASTSSGQVYHINKTDVEEVLQFVRLSLQSRKVNLLSVNKPGPSVDEHSLFVDESLHEFTVSVSGMNPHIGVVSPNGKPVQGPPKLNTVLSLQNIKAVNIIEPEPGQWKVKVGSDSEHSVRSTGLSDIDFNFGFSAVVTNKMEETYHRPLKGEKNSVLVVPTHPGMVYNLTTLKLIDLKGIEFQEIPLHPVPDKPGLYQGSTFVPPNDFFHLGVDGFDKDGFPLKRISPTAITGQSPEPPVVHMKPEVTAWLDKPVTISCRIESLVPFSSMWFKDGVPLTGLMKYNQTAELFWVVQNSTLADEGNYSCYANNVAGRSSSGTWLTITGLPPHIVTPPQILSALNQTAVLDCVVRSQLHYNVTWTRAPLDVATESAQKIQNDVNTRILPNGTLIVNAVKQEDEGWYTCTVENKGGSSEGHVYLAVREPVNVVVVPERFQFQQGDSVSLSCYASGTPTPTFVWKKDGVVLKQDDGKNLRLREEENGLNLVLQNADISYAGEYQCVAENDNEMDTGVTVGQYLEAPTVVAEEVSVLARVGGSVQLRCSVLGEPAPVIRWAKDDDQIITNSKYEVQQDGMLLINSAQVADSGEYMCIAENELGMGDDFISLEVGEPPQMVHTPRDTHVEINGNGTLPCVATGEPAPRISWTRKDGKQLNKSRIDTTVHGNLQITYVGAEDAGVYVCRVENVFGKAEYEAEVNVTGIVKPVLDSMNGNHPQATVNRGLLVELPCRIILSNPPPVITWYKDGEILDDEQMQWEGITVLANGSLIISYSTQQHEGTYECVASNVGGTVSQATTLHVLEPPSFPPAGPVEFKVRAGEQIELPCPVLGDPEPIVVWKKDGIPVSLSHTIYKNNDYDSLIITSASVADSGTYVCTAVNPAGEGRRAVALFVQVPPHITPGMGSVNAIDGQIVTLTCEVEATPKPTITWYKDEAPLSSYEDEVMYLDNNATVRFVAQFGSSGQYKCEAVNDAGSDRMEMSVQVFVPPSIYPPEDEIRIVSANQSESLSCLVSGYPPPRIQWHRNGVRASSDKHMSVNEDGILDISNIQPNMSGVYVCDAENAAGIIQKIFYVIVHVPPRIDVDYPTQIQLMEGDDYSLPCSAHGIPDPQISWRRDGQFIIGHKDEHLVLLEDGTLVITSATLNTTGIYTCIAENAKGNDQRHFLVEVLVPPSVLDSGKSRVEVIEGDSVVIACPAMDAVPPPEIQWLKDGRNLDLLMNERSDQVHFAVLDGGRSLKLEEAHSSDSGTYACVATNLAGHANAEITLDVLLSPYFEKFSYKQEETALAGTEVRFDCNVSGNPEPRLLWRKNNLPITPHTAPGVVLSPNRYSLVIPNVRPHDAGHYQCAATNRAGRNDRDFHLSVLVPPDLDGPVEEVQEAVKGETVLLQCPITGLPDPQIRWTKDGFDLNVNTASNVFLSKDKRILEISKVHPHDGGIYICMGSNKASSKEKHFNLTVFEPPVVHQQQFVEDLKVRVGDDVSLVCTARGQPMPDIKWLHNGHIVDKGIGSVVRSSVADRSSVEDHTLSLQQVEITDAGKYTCLASNVAGVAEKNYRLKVLVAPTFSVHRDDSNVIESVEGLPITIKCPVVGNPVPDVRWMKDSAPLDTVRAVAEGQLLRIENSRKEHSGNYTCVAHNYAGNISKSFQLDVLVPPVMADMEEQANLKVTTNEMLTLTCNVTGHPYPNILWFKGAVPITKQRWPLVKFKDHNRTLVIPEVSMKHNGRYSCLASNMAGDTELTFNVEIQEPPEVSADVPEKSSHTVVLHRRLVLKCPLHGSPPPKITWYKEGISIKKQLGSDFHVSSDGKQLHLMHALTDSAGNYSCVAQNSAGAKELHFEVYVLVPAEWSAWSAWSDCSVTCGPGERIKVRVCGEDAEEFVDESNCPGKPEQIQSCYMSECPIDGVWSEWSQWTSCSESCGRGTRRRYRKCNSPAPTHGGKPCLGADGQQEYCNQPQCPIHGKWSEWSDWSPCSASCGNGTQRRSRTCNSPPPAFGGKECIGLDTDFRECNTHKCPVNGEWSAWSEWSFCSVSCGHGNKRRYRTCTEPAPQHKGTPCKGENLQIEKCMARSCDNIPQLAALRVKGSLNGENLYNVIAANITDMGPRRAVSATIKDIIKQQAGWFPYLTFLLSPVSWNTAYETDEANNGYSLTNGNFRQHSQIEFATGEELVVTHVGRGIDEVGTLQVDIEVNGEVPLMQPEAAVYVEPFEEDYVQTSPSSLFASSTNTLRINGHKLPYTWNNTVSYDAVQGTMPYLVEKLSTRDIGVEYNPDLQEMTYMMSTAIGKKFDSDRCPEGFVHDERLLHCRDIDECQERSTNRCHFTQICENLFGSYRCFCHPGYKSRAIGKRCMDINECMEDPSVCSHQCRNVKGSFKCLCPRGYVLLEDGRTCSGLQYWTDQDGRSSGPHSEQLKSRALSLHRHRQDGRHEYYHGDDYSSIVRDAWSCPQGFEPSNGICQDVNECRIVPSVCSTDQTCLNTKGAYRCLETPCPSGYERDVATRNCVQFCDEPGVNCKEGALLTQTVSYTVLTLDGHDVQPYQDLMQITVFGEDGRQLPRTRYRITENETGKPFRVRIENGHGVLYTLKSLKLGRLYRIVILALSYDEDESNILYATKYVTFINLLDGS